MEKPRDSLQKAAEVNAATVPVTAQSKTDSDDGGKLLVDKSEARTSFAYYDTAIQLTASARHPQSHTDSSEQWFSIFASIALAGKL